MTTTTATPLDWTTVEFDADNPAALAIFSQVLTVDIGVDDALWIEPVGEVWSLSHNTNEVSRHATKAKAKAAGADYFSTL